MLQELRIQELPELRAHLQGELRRQREQFPQAPRRRLPLAELPVHGGEHSLRVAKGRQVDPERQIERTAIVTLPVGVEDQGEPVPPGMMGIEAQGLVNEGAAAPPLPGVGDEPTQARDAATVHRVEREGTLGRGPEGRDLPAIEQDLGQHLMRAVTGGVGLDRLPGRVQSPAQRIGLAFESHGVLALEDEPQRGPGVRVARRQRDRTLQCGPRCHELLRCQALEEAEAAQHGLVGAQLLGAPVAQRLAQRMRQDAMRIRDGRDDSRDELVLQLENAIQAERAIVGLGPEMSARLGVDELHRDADLASRLAKSPVDHVARAQLVADGAHVGRLARVAKRGAARDHPQVREAQHGHHDALGQPLGQGGEVRAAAAVLEGQHCDPEALVGAGGAGVSRRRRSRGRGHLGADRRGFRGHSA